MYCDKFQLQFKDGIVNLSVKYYNKCFWVYWIDAQPTNKGLSTQALTLLKSYGYTPLIAYKVITTAKNFWLKKLSDNLIIAYTECNCLKCQKQKPHFSTK